MVIYDKNQFTFNLVFVFLLASLIVLNVIYYRSFFALNARLEAMNEDIEKMESNQDFNFLQASHHAIDYVLLPDGLHIPTVNDFGVFNGPSMQPTIFDGHTLLESKYDGKSKLEEGQVVRFIRNDGKAVVHRIRADYGTTVFVQGDSLKDGEIIEKARITHIVIGVLFT